MAKPSPEQLNRFLQTHYPNRKERRAFEKRYAKQQSDIRAGKLKPKKLKIRRLTWWRKLINFIMRKY